MGVVAMKPGLGGALNRHAVPRWLVIVVISACATPPFSEIAGPTSTSEAASSTSVFEEPPPAVDTSRTTIEFNSLACNLSTLLGELQGAGTGTIDSVEEGLSGLPWDAPEREYALVRITVDRVAAQAAAAVTGHLLPVLEVSQTVDVIVYPDLEMTPLEPVVELAGTGTTTFFGLSGAGDVNDSDSTGTWFVRRVAIASDSSFAFTGFCSDLLDEQFADFAKALGRPADLDLAIELAAEVVSNASDSGVGPLEQTLIDSLY